VTWRSHAYALACAIRQDRHLDVLAAIRPSATWPADRLRGAQEGRLSSLLRYAFANVPFYRERLLAAGVVTGGEPPRVDLAQFFRLPPLTREDLRRHSDDLRDRGEPRRGTFTLTSGGTTGVPVRILRGRATYAFARAVQVWFDEWSGCSLGEPRVILTGRRPFLRERVRGWIGSIVRNELRLYAPHLAARRLTAYIGRINRHRPVQAVGAPWLLHEIARHGEASGRPIVPLRAVMTSSEALMPEMARALRRVFGAPVFNRYGTSELGPNACSCGVEPRLHVSQLTHLVEVLRPDGQPCEPGEPGEVVITHLVNREMPLIRYRIGDVAMPGPRDPCCCGRTLPSIAEVSGRVMDTFVKWDGTLVSGSSVRRFYRSVSGIRQFQVVQLAPTRVHVRLVERPEIANAAPLRQANLRIIEQHFRRVLGDDCRVTFEFLDEIPRERSGKYRPTVCLIPESDLPPGRRGLSVTLDPGSGPAGEQQETRRR
jgi:phenylacetate-CoA ligase